MLFKLFDCENVDKNWHNMYKEGLSEKGMRETSNEYSKNDTVINTRTPILYKTSKHGIDGNGRKTSNINYYICGIVRLQ